ncbi:MAG TPA: TetR/AcrR family transcriptional regulator [Pseudonocardiaceae bacterium]|jgi:DNA-binding transcriptional regulator YbjK|nr:TetR/AcrR family transcriptional regulator [Pseudonocardiaceae bacterium]
MPRTGDEPDTHSRRPLLADAAITILARDGGRGLTHRAVDRQANVPEGTTKNYYATRQAILEAAAHRMAQQHRAAVDHLRATTPTGATPTQLRQLYPALVRRADRDPTQTLAMVELYLEAVRHPEVRAALATMATTNAHATAGLHHAAGVPSDTTHTGLLDAYLLGVLLTRLALPGDTLTTTGLDDPDTVGTGLFDATTPTTPQPREHPTLSIVCHPRNANRRQPVTYSHGR